MEKGPVKLAAFLCVLCALCGFFLTAESAENAEDKPGIVLGAGAQGLTYNVDSTGQPPDPSGAIGPKHFVASVQYKIGLFDRQVKRVETIKTREFFDIPSDTYDTRVLFHPTLKKFFIAGIGMPGVMIAQSNDAEPATLSDWQVDGPTAPYWCDFPIVAPADGGYLLIYVSPADKLTRVDPNLKFDAVTLPLEWQIGGTGMLAADTAPGGAAWLVRRKPGTVNNGKMQILHIANPFDSTPQFTTHELSVPDWLPSNVPTQPGGTIIAPTTHCNAAFAEVAGRKRVVACMHGGGPQKELRVHWYEFDVTSAPVLLQTGVIDPGPQVHAWLGSIAISPSGDIGMTYNRSSPTEFISVGVAGRKLSDPLGKMRPGVAAKTSSQKILHYGRYGDFSTISADPAGPGFWAVNEYSEGVWSTWIQQFTLTGDTTEPPAAWYPLKGTLWIDGQQWLIDGKAQKK